jgi:eukaryotic-like serine/threonine-protein kinase
MVAGRPPFLGDSPVTVASKQVLEQPTAPSKLNRDVSPDLDAVILRALAKNPANRYQSAGEFRDDLRRVIAGQDVEATPLLPAGAGATQVISRPPPTAVLPPTEPDEDRRKVWLGVLIGVLVLLILGGGAYLLAQNLLGDEPKPQVPVPDVVGMQFDEASALLVSKGFTVNEPIEEVNDSKDPGEVLSQDPAANVQAEEGSEVTLTIAKAPRTFIVPDLTGMTVEEATALLEQENLTLGEQSEAASDTFDVGDIISQFPPANRDVPKDTPVDVVVSTGPEIIDVSVPDVTCLSFGQAKSQLTAKGLQINDDGTAPVNPLCSNPNKIAAQDPTSGTTVPTGTVVNVYFGETTEPSAEPT